MLSLCAVAEDAGSHDRGHGEDAWMGMPFIVTTRRIRDGKTAMFEGPDTDVTAADENGAFPAILNDLGLMGDGDLSFTMRWMIFRGVRRRRLFVVLESKEGKKLSIELTVLLMGSRCVGSGWEDAEGVRKLVYLGL